MSRQELADAVSEHVPHPVDYEYIAKLERGEVRWPALSTRSALRAVLRAQGDHELGFYITRRADRLPATQTAGDAGREGRSRQEVRSLASSAPPIVVPQRRIPARRLRGRSALLDGLEKFIAAGGRGDTAEDDSSVIVLHGIGGAGKTTVALELAHRARDRGYKTWWIPADDPRAMVAALHAVSFDVGATEADLDRGHAADALWRRLNALAEPWLLVLDNVDEPGRLGASRRGLAEGTGWLRPPAHPGAVVLVTSRDGRPRSWAPWIKLQPVPMLDISSGAAVLVDLAPGAGRVDDAQRLAEALGGLPLALDLAGRYLGAAADDLRPSPRPSSFAAYVATLANGSAEADVSSDDESIHDGERSALFATWEMSVDLLTRQGYDLARPLLRLLASFAEAPLPIEVLRPDVLERSPAFPGGNPERLSRTIGALVELGLIVLARNSNQPSGLISMHPVVRMATRANTEISGDASAYRELSTSLLIAASDPVYPAVSEAPHQRSSAQVRVANAGG